MTATPTLSGADAEVHDDPRWALVMRVAASQHLKSSARLRDFLFYVADCAIRDAPMEATEQQIGIRVFHRSPGYNSSEDSIVRTDARLLRQKLAAYFADEGKGEEIVLEMPKGHYLPVFRRKSSEVAAKPVLEEEKRELAPLPLAVVTGAYRPRRRLWALVLLPILAAGSMMMWRPWTKTAGSQGAVEKFWSPFFTEDPPLVIFSNALFVGDSTNGLRYAPPQPQGKPLETDNYVDTYTGIGELASVYRLTRLFDAHRSQFVLKRSLLVTWDEAQMKNLVFIGSTAENPSLRVMQAMTDFTMTASPDSAGVVNHHPMPGEPEVYSRPEHPLTKDYAILALLPGVQPGKRMIVFSGLTTFGTEAAVDFVCRPDSAAELLRKVTGPKGKILPFEAVLETTIGGGVPLQTRLLTIRVHKW